jgi:molybdate transport system ATP-binding protein
VHSLSVELKHVDLDRGDQAVLRDVTWRIQPGQRWALIGHNGAGKTQLLKLIAGDVWPTPGSRRVYRQGTQSQDEPLGIKELIAYVGAERQDKYARYAWNLPVFDLVATGLFATDIKLDEANATQRRQVRSMLRKLGLERFARRRMLTLSYGEQRLALVARALVAKPRLLLLDEVFNGLDEPRRATMMRYLERSRRSRLPWVLSIHRAEDLPSSVTHVLVLEKGRVRYRGRRSAKALREFFSPRPAPLPDATVRPAVPSAARSPRIRIAGADVYVNHHAVLRNLDWEIRPGEHWAVVGRNGSGKSTLLRLLYGELSPALGGIIERAGFPRGTPLEDFRKTVGVLSPQLQSEHAREDLTVEEIVISGRHASIGLNAAPSSADRRAARRALDAFGLAGLAGFRPRQLSYGQLRRVLLARALVNRPRLLLLDEPCTGLDAATRAIVLAQLEKLARSGVQVVMATHHASDVIPSVNRILRLRNGRASLQAAAFRKSAASRRR